MSISVTVTRDAAARTRHVTFDVCLPDELVEESPAAQAFIASSGFTNFLTDSSISMPERIRRFADLCESVDLDRRALMGQPISAEIVRQWHASATPSNVMGESPSGGQRRRALDLGG